MVNKMIENIKELVEIEKREVLRKYECVVKEKLKEAMKEKSDEKKN